MKITVANRKGGVGKSTLAIHLATLLADEAPTLLVDADPERTIVHWVEGAGGAKEFGPDFELTGLPVRTLHRDLPGLLEKGGFVHLVIDTPGQDSAITRSAVLAVDMVLVPTGPTVTDLDRIPPTLELVNELEMAHSVDLRVVLHRVRSRIVAARALRRHLRDQKVAVCQTEIPDWQAIANALGTVPDFPLQETLDSEGNPLPHPYVLLLEELRRPHQEHQ